MKGDFPHFYLPAEDQHIYSFMAQHTLNTKATFSLHTFTDCWLYLKKVPPRSNTRAPVIFSSRVEIYSVLSELRNVWNDSRLLLKAERRSNKIICLPLHAHICAKKKKKKVSESSWKRTNRGVLGAGGDAVVVEGIPLDVQHVASVARHSGVVGVHFTSLREKRQDDVNIQANQSAYIETKYIEVFDSRRRKHERYLNSQEFWRHHVCCWRLSASTWALITLVNPRLPSHGGHVSACSRCVSEWLNLQHFCGGLSTLNPRTAARLWARARTRRCELGEGWTFTFPWH